MYVHLSTCICISICKKGILWAEMKDCSSLSATTTVTTWLFTSANDKQMSNHLAKAIPGRNRINPKEKGEQPVNQNRQAPQTSICIQRAIARSAGMGAFQTTQPCHNSWWSSGTDAMPSFLPTLWESTIVYTHSLAFFWLMSFHLSFCLLCSCYITSCSSFTFMLWSVFHRVHY